VPDGAGHGEWVDLVSKEGGDVGPSEVVGCQHLTTRALLEVVDELAVGAGAHPASFRRWEKRSGFEAAALDPAPKVEHCAGREPGLSWFSTLGQPDVQAAGVEIHVAQIQVGQFGDAQPGSGQDSQDRGVAPRSPPGPGRRGDSHQLFEFVRVENSADVRSADRFQRKLVVNVVALVSRHQPYPSALPDHLSADTNDVVGRLWAVEVVPNRTAERGRIVGRDAVPGEVLGRHAWRGVRET